MHWALLSECDHPENRNKVKTHQLDPFSFVEYKQPAEIEITQGYMV